MSETLSEYTSGDDEDSESEDFGGGIEIERFDFVGWDDEAEEVVAASALESDDFTGRILHYDRDDFMGDRDGALECIERMREFRENRPEIEHRLDTFGLSISNEKLPVKYSYIMDRAHPSEEDEVIGVRVETEIGDDVYRFETVKSTNEGAPDLFEDQLTRQMQRMIEEIWNDQVIDNVTLDQNDD